ncbi:hypothetical protein BDV12DRAFT_167714 [Aspergillus spectabilis]
MEAVKHGHVDIAAWLHDHGKEKFDVNQSISWHLKGSLFAALHDCPPDVRIQMIIMLLGEGVDQNRMYAAVIGTPLQAALQQQQDRSEIFNLLLEHGATSNAHVK